MAWWPSSPIAARGFLDFSERTLREAATLRAALEEFAATLLVPRLNTEQLSRLEALVCRMELAASRGTAREFNEADYRFHDEIFESSGHRTLHEMWRGMQRRIRAFQASATGSAATCRRWRSAIERSSGPWSHGRSLGFSGPFGRILITYRKN